MEPAHYSDPLEEALSHGSQRVAQLASLAAAMAQVIIQRRALDQARKAAAGDGQAKQVLDDQERLLRQQARLAWAPAHDAQWLAQAGFTQTARAWASAAAWADTEPAAAAAQRKCEGRLRRLHPYAMARYDRLRHDGLAPLDAMGEAAPLFARAPGVRVGDPVPERFSLRVYATPDPDSAPADVPGERPVPDPRAAERAAAEQRGQQIIDRIQARARAGHRPEPGADELAMILEAATNLPEDLIDKLTGRPPEAEGGAERSPAQVAAENFPVTVADTVAAAAAGPRDPAHVPAADADIARHRGPSV
jgi:hypothetical protein